MYDFIAFALAFAFRHPLQQSKEKDALSLINIFKKLYLHQMGKKISEV
jgi:hypothetical protein